MKILAIVDIPDDEKFENIKEGMVDIWWDEKSFSRLYTANKWVKHPRGVVFRPMPEKKEGTLSEIKGIPHKDTMESIGFCMGWNACLKEILGEKNESNISN